MTNNSPVTVNALTVPNAPVSIRAKLTTTITNVRVVTYVRAPSARPRGLEAHTVEIKKLPPCRKGVQGCVARIVVRRIAKTVVLFQTTVHTRADKRGHVHATVRISYVTRKVVQATLTVTVQTPRGTGTRNTHVKVVPPPAHKASGQVSSAAIAASSRTTTPSMANAANVGQVHVPFANMSAWASTPVRILWIPPPRSTGCSTTPRT